MSDKWLKITLHICICVGNWMRPPEALDISLVGPKWLFRSRSVRVQGMGPYRPRDSGNKFDITTRCRVDFFEFGMSCATWKPKSYVASKVGYDVRGHDFLFYHIKYKKAKVLLTPSCVILYSILIILGQSVHVFLSFSSNLKKYPSSRNVFFLKWNCFRK